MTTLKLSWLSALVLALTFVLGCGDDEDDSAPAASEQSARPTAAASQPTGPVHRNLSWGWSVSYPQGWQVNSTDPAVVGFTSPPNLPRALVAINSGRRPPAISRTELLNA